MAAKVPDRRFFNHIQEWRVGLTSGTYAYVGESTGLGPLSWEPEDPWVILPIPRGASHIRQLIGNFNVSGWLDVADYEAVTVLLYETSIDGSANKAMTTTSRNTIGYFALVVSNVKIVNSSDTRTSTTSTFIFANTDIRYVAEKFTALGPENRWRVYFHADSVSQVDI